MIGKAADVQLNNIKPSLPRKDKQKDITKYNPTTTTNENLQKKFDLAAQKSLGNYSFYLGASNHNIEEIKRKNDIPPVIKNRQAFPKILYVYS